MKRYISIFFNIIFIFTIVNGQVSDSLKKGDFAPSWSLKSNQGNFEFLNNWTVKDNRQLRKPMTQPDRHAVIMIFFATWCPPCVKQLDPLEDIFQKYKNKKVKFFIVDITEASRKDSKDKSWPKAEYLFKEKKITIPILNDNIYSAADKYKIKVIPTIFVIDKSQIVRDVIKGFDKEDDFKGTFELSKIIEELTTQ